MIATARAAAVLAAPSLWDPSILWTGAYLAAALLFGALVMEVFRRYLNSERNDRLTPSDELAHYRSLYEQGTISEEEFTSLRNLLGGEIRRGIRKTAPALDATPAAPQTREMAPPPNGEAPNNKPPSPPETGIKPA